jgi:DNA-binding transcriptional ArsR family regulator
MSGHRTIDGEDFEMQVRLLKALACESRLKILDYLKEPNTHFPHQTGFDLDKDGVWNKLIAKKLGIGQVAVTIHMGWLISAGLVTSKKAGTRCFYKRDEKGISEAIASLHRICSDEPRYLPKDIAAS